MGEREIRELSVFLNTLFAVDETVEIRPIEIWSDAKGRRKSRVLKQFHRWLTPDEILGRQTDLVEVNCSHRANIFMGVCPRNRFGGTKKDDVLLSRSLWADLDDVSLEVALWRCDQTKLPRPSLAVDSGSGIHLYWLLESAIHFHESTARAKFEARLKSVCRNLGSDATCDANRLLRLPGFWNTKNNRNGQPPQRCRLVLNRPFLRYSIREFPAYQPQAFKRQRTQRSGLVVGNPAGRNASEITRACRRLEVAVVDRSRRDFGVVCDLLRSGLTPAEIWALVAEQSKFATDGYRYFATTLENARSAVGQ